MTIFLLLVCLALLIALHLRLGRWKDSSLSNEGVFLHTSRAHTDGTPEIHIHILNPLEVAEKESAFGRFLGKLSPNLISRQVYLKTAETIGHEFRERGIRARIDVRYTDSDKSAG